MLKIDYEKWDWKLLCLESQSGTQGQKSEENMALKTMVRTPGNSIFHSSFLSLPPCLLSCPPYTHTHAHTRARTGTRVYRSKNYSVSMSSLSPWRLRSRTSIHLDACNTYDLIMFFVNLVESLSDKVWVLLSFFFFPFGFLRQCFSV